MISIFGTWQLFRCRNYVFLKKRKSVIVYGLNISYIISMVVTLLVRIALINIELEKDKLEWFLIICKVMFGNWWLLLFFLNIDAFNNWFQMKITYYTLQFEWQSIINHTSTEYTKQSNWFLSNKRKLGIMFIGIGIIHFNGFFLQSIFESNIISMEKQNILIYQVLFLLLIKGPIISFYVVIIQKTQSIKDVYFVWWENRIKYKMFICLIVLSVSVIIMSSTLNMTENEYKLFISIVAPVFILILFGLSVVSTFGIMIKNKHHYYSENGDNKRPNSFANAIVKDQLETEQKLAELQKQKTTDIKLEHLLSIRKPLNLFMQHLSKEYSTECLLSYIEFTQFQDWLLQQMRHHCEYLDVPLILYDTPSNIPISDIITKGEEEKSDIYLDFGTDHVDVPSMIHDPTTSSSSNYHDAILKKAKIKAHKLFNKYIQTEAEYEINVSGLIRNKLIRILSYQPTLLSNDKIKLKDLVQLFEKPRAEMLMLLNFSFLRFKQTIDYGEILKYFNKKNKEKAITPLSINIDAMNELHLTPVQNQSHSNESPFDIKYDH